MFISVVVLVVVLIAGLDGSDCFARRSGWFLGCRAAEERVCVEKGGDGWSEGKWSQVVVGSGSGGGLRKKEKKGEGEEGGVRGRVSAVKTHAALRAQDKCEKRSVGRRCCGRKVRIEEA